MYRVCRADAHPLLSGVNCCTPTRRRGIGRIGRIQGVDAGAKADLKEEKGGPTDMSAQEMPPPFVLYRMMTGFYVSQAIYVTARLGIADFLSNGPLDASD